MSLKVDLDLMDTFSPDDLERILKDVHAITESPFGKNFYPAGAVMRVGIDKKPDGRIDYQVTIHSLPPSQTGSYKIKSYTYQSTPAKPLHGHLNRA